MKIWDNLFMNNQFWKPPISHKVSIQRNERFAIAGELDGYNRVDLSIILLPQPLVVHSLHLTRSYQLFQQEYLRRLDIISSSLE